MVSRSQARTRRSNAARSLPGNVSGVKPSGSTSASRASVSASIPLLFAWRDRNRRKSAAFWLDTRYTAWPRALKNTAIGSHAGPVGSITTSNRVPRGAPATAACSINVRLATLGSQRRRHTSRPEPSRTRTVWADAIPRSMPTSRRCLSTVLPSPN